MLEIVDKSNWQKVTLGDVVNKIEENDKENAKHRFQKFLKVEHFDAETLHVKRWGDQEVEELPPTFYKIFRKGQVLFPTRNPHLRRTVLADFDGICGEKTLTLEPADEQVNSEFIPFLFHSETFVRYTTGAIIGSTNPHVRWRDVAKLEFLLPPLDQQTQLAELLWQGDSVIESKLFLQHRLIALKKVLRNKYFVSNALEKRVKLKTIASLNAGGTPSTEVSEFWEGGSILWMSSGEVHNKRINNTEKRITEAGLKHSSAKLIPINTTVIALAGQGKTKGTVAITEVELTTNQSVAAIIPNTDKVNPYYLYHNIDSKYLEFRHITGKSNSRTGLNLSILKDFEINFHSLEKQNEIAEELNRIDETIELLNLDIININKIQKSLINQIF